MEKILVVEDEHKLNDIIRDYLISLGYVISQCFDGLSAVKYCEENTIDLIVLDLLIPGLDGIETARKIRAHFDYPIIMLTARDSEADKLLGLEVGADDYMTKPFSVRELAARIRAVLRRYDHSSELSGSKEILTHGNLELDISKHQVRKNGKPLRFTSSQFELIKILMQHPGRVFNRNELIEAVSGYAYDGYQRTIDVQIKNIRKILEDDAEASSIIETVWGVGYKMSEETNEQT